MFFSDKSKFNLFGNDGKYYVQRFQSEALNPKRTKKTVKFGGGSVMVFRMFSRQGMSPLVCFNTRVNASIYKNLLEDHVVPIINNSFMNGTIFMQNNAPATRPRVS